MNPESIHTAAVEDPEFVTRLASALELLERGEQPDTAALCADRPDLLPELEAALADTELLPGLHRAASAFDPLVGSTVNNRYVLRARVGSGGMGVVYRADDLELRRTVAIKMLRPELTTGDELEARLGREAEVLASMQHPTILTVFDRGRSADGRAYIVMPLLEGRTASELLEAAPGQEHGSATIIDTGWMQRELGGAAALDGSYVRQVVAWIARVARGLHLVHTTGIVHRDVKPSNIFVQQDGSPVLLDFGLVTLGPDTTLAMRDTALGTPAYMAPEQLDTKAVATPAVDVYGLTATLYHLLTLHRPFDGTPSQVLAALQRSEPTPAHRLRPGLPRDMQAILDKGMARDPRQRYASAADLAEDLESWLDYRPVVARPVSTMGRFWRRAWRTTVVKTLTAVAALALVGVTTSFLIEAWATAREARRIQLVQSIPAPTLFSPTPLRRIADAGVDAAVGEVLAELADVDPEPSPSRVMYAGYLRQRGRYQAASQQMRSVAEHYGTEALRALANLYATNLDGPDLPLDNLPAPTIDADRFALAYHLMWQISGPHLQRSASLIEACAPGTDVVEEFRTFHEFVKAQGVADASARRQLMDNTYEAMLRMEESRGFRTAMSRKNAAMLLIGLQRHSDAVDAARDGLALAPGDFSLWQNLAFAQFSLNRTDDARHSLERLLSLQPSSYSGHEHMLFVLLEQREFDRAEAWIEGIPFAAGAQGRVQRAACQGRLLVERAFAALRSGDPEEARQLAATAYQTIEASQGGDPQLTEQMLVALAIQDPVKYHADLARVADPLSFQRLREVALLMPEQLDQQQTEAMRKLLMRISFGLAPGQRH